jgi:hypothetical protein
VADRNDIRPPKQNPIVKSEAGLSGRSVRACAAPAAISAETPAHVVAST